MYNVWKLVIDSMYCFLFCLLIKKIILLKIILAMFMLACLAWQKCLLRTFLKCIPRVYKWNTLKDKRGKIEGERDFFHLTFSIFYIQAKWNLYSPIFCLHQILNHFSLVLSTFCLCSIEEFVHSFLRVCFSLS